MVLRGYGEMGVNPLKNPIEVYIACWEWGKYLGEEALAEGVDVCVSSWTRIAPNTLPALAKAGANYMNSQLINMEALATATPKASRWIRRATSARARARTSSWCATARSTRRRWAARCCPASRATRCSRWRTSSAFRWWRPSIPREMLYIADEVFFSGTAAEITPIRSVDRITVGKGRRGPVAEGCRRSSSE